ncbi:MAG: ABC transporter ATP-binding protein [Eubacteriales bacterium]|nr:ABC transporter ATP-binding protein [Eubacteriales bacterium]MDD3199028.1 ABC transporter ATP-binding protein [Eubacteriales bacterium]MDD4629486.1 ABC transporter ATP-binding protein [Eubacteriales bacterium]
MTDALIRIEGLSKIYDTGEIQVEALKTIDLTIKTGEFIAVMGASGSGKSTLMNILGCLDRPTEGSYYLEGVDVMEKSDDELSAVRNKKIGFVFQSFNLISRTSALKNVELPMVYGRIGSEERKERARKLLKDVGLEDRAHHMPNELSGGQKQRVAIARALANSPQIILADEPTGNLDSQSSVEIMDIFCKLNRQEGKTVIIVTHERDIAEFSDRIITFRDGHIIKDEIKVDIQGEIQDKIKGEIQDRIKEEIQDGIKEGIPDGIKWEVEPC